MKKPHIVILAGGEGKRFRPLVTCKTLFPFLGKPLLQHTLEMIESAGFQDVIIATNEYNNAWLQNYQSRLRIKTKKQPQPLGMSDAVLHVKKEIGTDPCIILNAGDIVEPQLLKDIMNHIEKDNPYAAVVGKKVKTHLPAGYLDIDENRVIGIMEKPEKGKEPSDLINLVFHYFSDPQHFIEKLEAKQGTEDDIYEQALSEIMQEKHVTWIPYTGYWQKLKYPHFVLDMTELFLSTITKQHISSSANISDAAHINGPVWIDEDVVLHTGALVQGPAYLGKGAVIGNNSLVRHSLVEERAVIGFSSEVARSYIGPHCMLHHNFIGDSVLERKVNPSWGTTTGNLRFDGKPISLKLPDGSKILTDRTKLGVILAEGVFCGINCSLMPGVTMGKNATVKPGSVVYDSVV